MSKHQVIRFEDGAGYEEYMGRWSRLAGLRFLDWLSPAAGGRWLDVGCGNGAFTELLFERCAPLAVHGIDPSEAQLQFATRRLRMHGAAFSLGDAMQLPFSNGNFDIAVMPLVIFFVPEPARGLSEMKRVVKQGGMVTAYAWDMPGGGHPYHALQAEMRTMDIQVPEPPSPEASRQEVMHLLWSKAGFEDVQTEEIIVERTFADFESYWSTVLTGPSVGSQLKRLSSRDSVLLRERMRARLPAGSDARITYSARANAVRGRVKK